MSIIETGELTLQTALKGYLKDLNVEKLQVDPKDLKLGNAGRIAIVGSFEGDDQEMDAQAAKTARELYVRGHIGSSAIVGVQAIRPTNVPETQIEEDRTRLLAAIENHVLPTPELGSSRFAENFPFGQPEISAIGSDDYRAGRLGYLLQRAWLQFDYAVSQTVGNDTERKSLVVITDPAVAAWADKKLSEENMAGGGVATFNELGRTGTWVPSSRAGSRVVKTGSIQSQPLQAEDPQDDTLQRLSDAVLSHRSQETGRSV